MLPSFDTHGHLPPGVHPASADEIEERFGIFVVSDRRLRLFAKLKQFMALCRASEIVVKVFLGGSFVSAKSDPNDIDIILVLSSDVDFNTLTAVQATVLDRDALRRVFRGSDLDVLVVREGTGRLQTAIEFFQTNGIMCLWESWRLISMAILNRKQLEFTQQKIAKLELALEEMKREESPKAYAVLSKGFVAQIDQMRGEIDHYLRSSLSKAEEEQAVLS
jgi:predicted nucleotidyltransferase